MNLVTTDFDRPPVCSALLVWVTGTQHEIEATLCIGSQPAGRGRA